MPKKLSIAKVTIADIQTAVAKWGYPAERVTVRLHPNRKTFQIFRECPYPEASSEGFFVAWCNLRIEDADGPVQNEVAMPIIIKNDDGLFLVSTSGKQARWSREYPDAQQFPSVAAGAAALASIPLTAQLTGCEIIAGYGTDREKHYIVRQDTFQEVTRG